MIRVAGSIGIGCVIAILSGAAWSMQDNAYEAGTDIKSLSQELFNRSADARGAYLCDKVLAKKRTRIFDKRYGQRIARLRAHYAVWHGPDPDVFSVASCIHVVDRSHEYEDWKNDLEDFDKSLGYLESEYIRATR